MKTVSSIISSIKGNSNFDKLNNLDSFNIIKTNLPKSLSNSIEFMYLKNSTLFFVFNHPAFRHEFEYKKESIKKVIDILKKNNKIELDISDVKSFVTNKIKEEKIERQQEIYQELSNAEFENRIQDENLAKILEEIRESINAKR
jgi:precorrin isomerase